MTRENTISSIQIVEYEDKFASSIAKMWNDSKDAWGGSVKTEEQIIEKHRSSDNLHTFLAIDNNQVVGYCGLSIYKEDIGSLYIPLLNVRPDYYGKKVGKLLLLHALKVTVAKKWPRLDLYTWAGNTKAVPLYKRCGFFWEDEDSYTHLMNFIPAVLNDNLLAPYIGKIDWYKDMLRTLELKPDGRQENGFTYYDYEWANADTSLTASFERTGRGLSRIETDDFIIKLSLKEHELLEGEDHEIKCYVKNKSGKPLAVEISSCSHERVVCDFDHKYSVEEEVTATNTFYLKAGLEPEKGKTFPTIFVDVSVNGLMTTFKLGINPKTPITIDTKTIPHVLKEGFKTTVDLELENNLFEPVLLELELPNNKYLSFHNPTYQLLLEGKGRRYISIPATVLSLGFFQEDIICRLKLEGDKEKIVTKTISVGLKGAGERFFGENKHSYSIYNGTYRIRIYKADNVMKVGTNRIGELPFVMFAPMLGKPFSNELSKNKPDKTETTFDKTSIILALYFQSTAHPNIHIVLRIQLYAEGIVKRWVTLENRQSSPVSVHVQETFYHDWSELYFPLKGDVVMFNEADTVEPGDIASKDISGNWYFSKDEVNPIGVFWTEANKMTMEGWKMHFQSLKDLKGHTSCSFPPIYMSIGAYTSWRDVEQAATGMQSSHTALKGEIIFAINANNPVIDNSESISILFSSYRNNQADGEGELFVNGKSVSKQTFPANNKINLPLEETKWKAVNKVQTIISTDKRQSYFNTILLRPHGEILQSRTTEEGYEIYSIDNGIINFRAAPHYYPGLFSLKVQQTEWLDQAFPNLIPKSWWNPWAGGIKAGPPDLSVHSLLKEKTKAEFVEILDNFDNVWSGIRLDTDISHHAKWKGLSYSQYYVTMPNIPILAVFVQVHNTAGKRMTEEEWHHNLFLKTGKESCILHLHQKKNHNQMYTVGREEQEIILTEDFYITQAASKDKLHLLTDTNSPVQYYTNKEVIQLVCTNTCEREKDGYIHMQPSFLYFDEDSVPFHQLESVRQLQFRLSED
ncbi:GNAT family N-acetyltransferase [Niallia circulans]|uniref:GNAT family N-acetyltransferase n=1 Tax=Niallia circulans TaxID=1397 RepID=A0A553SLD9_NIACI|nr:GNAT family N-acetyltransferase [Niallia circulans]TRZ37802.1 GNAT family N-acetyltransferase [Niallia circulans]